MTFWGSTAVGIDRLAAFRDVDVLCFDHGNEREMQTLMATPLWQMPFVREQRFQRAGGVVLRRDAVGHAFCPRTGWRAGRQSMSTRIARFPALLLTLLFLAHWH
jgi:hypothetical protein